ncbi:MAG: hypothetical protein L6Q97_11110 [Thermoanaerobaculia bacterium]|nr:hypothetical protein [Thermoanaerobaculia bacterium]
MAFAGVSFYLIVTDLELMASETVKLILAGLLLFGVGYNIWQFVRAKTPGYKLVRAGLALFFLAAEFPVGRALLVEGRLLFYPAYTAGTTIGPCQVFARGKGIEFEYQVAGKTYKNCVTHHPVPADSIRTPGGRYYVRYTARHPEEGRMDFNKKAE